jgi:hypothetical protein
MVQVSEPRLRVDVERLMKLRLVVARVGEMDLARWWNTHGQLGSLGAAVLRRGFPRTYHFAQARSVFAVAAARCKEVYDAPGAVTLWHLPSTIQDEFDQRWEGWLDDAASWATFFTEVESCGPHLTEELSRLNLIEQRHVDQLERLRRTAGQRAVQVPGQFEATADDITMLALAFSRGEEANLAVPFQLCAVNQ